MDKPLVTISLNESTDNEAEVRRLRVLLENAELHSKCRFAMLSFCETPGEAPVLVITTSASEPTALERHLVAAVAPAAFDRRAAWEAGVANGIARVLIDEYGSIDDAPKKWREKVRKLATSVAEATIGSIELTRITVAPFGLELADADEGAAVFVKRERDDA